MSDQQRNEPMTLDERLTAALEAAPSVVIPADFALRVMRGLPERARTPVYSATSPGIGRRVAFCALFVLLAAMLAIGVRAGGSVALTAVEWSLTAEFILLTVWMSLRPQALR